MTSLLNKYLLKHLTVALLFITFALTAAIWLTQAIRLLDLVIEDGAPLHEFFKVALLTLPTFLGLILPICFIGAVIFTYNRLTLDSELVILRASGLSPLEMAKPAFMLATAIIAICFSLSLWLGPNSKRELVLLEKLLGTQYGTMLLSEGVFNDIGDDITVYMRERDANGVMHGLMMNDRRDEKDIVIFADKGQMVQGPNGNQLIIYNGLRQEIAQNPAQLTELSFERYVFDLQNLNSKSSFRWSKPSERSTKELLQEPTSNLDIRFKDSLKAELHERFAMPFLSLSFITVVMAILLGGEFNRRGQTRKIINSIIAITAIQGIALITANLIKDNISLFPLLYLATTIPAIWGFFELYKLGKPKAVPPTGPLGASQ